MRITKEIVRILGGARAASVIDTKLLESWGVPPAAQTEVRKYLKAFVTQQIDIALTDITRRDSKEKLRV